MNPKIDVRPCMEPQRWTEYGPYTKAELAQLPFSSATKRYLASWKLVDDFIPREFFWYGDDFFTVSPLVTPEVLKDIRDKTGGPGWERMSVVDQCGLFGLDLLVTTASKLSGLQLTEKPYSRRSGVTVEKFVLDCFIKDGWRGFFDEGLFYWTISRLIGEKLARAGVPNGQWDEHGEEFGGAVLTSEQDVALRAAIHSVTEEEIRKAVIQISKSDKKLVVDKLAVEIIWEVWRCMDFKVRYKILEADICGYGASGWPDLLLVGKEGYLFVEVKSKRDHFHKNQAYWLRNIYKPIGLPFRVVHLTD